MNLQRIHVNEYRVLRDLTVEFPRREPESAGYSLHFLVGVNGTGKSTLLRAVATLFKQIERRQPVGFPFALHYRNKDRDIQLTNMTAEGNVEARIGSERITSPDSLIDLLPDHVVCFTTGREDGWLEQLKASPPESGAVHLGPSLRDMKPKDWFLQETPATRVLATDEKPSAPRPGGRVRMIKSSRVPLLMGLGWLADQSGAVSTGLSDETAPKPSPLSAVLEEAGFARPTLFTLRCRVQRPLIVDEDLKILEELETEYATRTIHQGPDRLLIFDLQNDLRRLTHNRPLRFRTFLDLFLFLDRMAEPYGEGEEPVLQEVNLFLSRRPAKGEPAPPLQHFSGLSDGEQDFLGRMALFALLRENESLILIDEPEVHFNDFWKRKIVHLLNESLTGTHSHVLMATHSSITLTDADREQIRLLDQVKGQTVATAPTVQTFAGNPSDIVVELFQAPVPTGEFAAKRLERLLEQVIPPHRPDARARKELIRKIKQELEGTAPGYFRFRLLQALMTLEGER